MTDGDYPAHPALEVDTNDLPVTFRPADIRVIKAMTGMSPAELTTGDAEEADRIQMLAFMQLRRQYPDEHTKTLWDLAEQADITVVDGPVDPTSGDTKTGSPPSAATGV